MYKILYVIYDSIWKKKSAGLILKKTKYERKFPVFKAIKKTVFSFLAYRMRYIKYHYIIGFIFVNLDVISNDVCWTILNFFIN